MPLNIFITGATGYIGGVVLGRLLVHPERETFSITALVRDKKKAERLATDFGVKPVLGSLDDKQVIEDAAADADVVINTADADHVPGAKAILAGIQRRHKTSGKKPILIHTSGTAVFSDTALGMHSSDVISSDLDIPSIESLPSSAPHRIVDVLVTSADIEGYARTHIVIPGIVYGNATGSVSESGLSNRHSIVVPFFIKLFVKLGRVGVVGAGKNVWPSVEVGDLADFYLLLFDAIRKRPEHVPHGREGYYIGENGEGEMYELCKTIGVALAKRGKVENPEPQSFSDEEADVEFGPVYKAIFGSNARSKGDRPRALGWKPKYTNADFIESIDPEVDAVLSKL